MQIWSGRCTSLITTSTFLWFLSSAAARGCTTSFPNDVSSTSSRNPISSSILAASNLVGLQVNTPALSFQTCSSSAPVAAASIAAV